MSPYPKREKLRIAPITNKQACRYIAAVHRHHDAPAGFKFAVCVVDSQNVIRGVATAGRPSSRNLDDGMTIEVTRVATDGTPNACSQLYGACRRIALEMGYRRGVSYLLEEESGHSIEAAGWIRVAKSAGGTWDRESRRRDDPNPTVPKWRFEAPNMGKPAPAPVMPEAISGLEQAALFESS